MTEPIQLEMFRDVLKPVSFRDESDDRWDAALLDGCPRGFLALVSGKVAEITVAEQYDAVTELMVDMEISTISRIVKISKRRLENFLAFGSLPKELQDAIRERRISDGVSLKLIKLSTRNRAKAVAIYLETGKLTLDDVESISRVARDESVEALPDSLFDDLPEISEPQHTKICPHCGHVLDSVAKV